MRRPIGRVVERAAYALVVERRPLHVEEHVLRGPPRGRCGAAPASGARAPDAARRETRAERVGDDREIRGAAPDAPRPPAICSGRARPACAPRPRCGRRTRPAGARRGDDRKCGLRTSVPPRRRPRQRSGTARCRAARRRRSAAAGCPRARRTRTGSQLVQELRVRARQMDRDRARPRIGLDAGGQVAAAAPVDAPLGPDDARRSTAGRRCSRVTRRNRSIEARKSSGRTGAPFENRSPGRSVKT